VRILAFVAAQTPPQINAATASETRVVSLLCMVIG
jgi:hypothetical protein